MEIWDLLDTAEKNQVLIIQEVLASDGLVSLEDLHTKLSLSYSTLDDYIGHIITLSKSYSQKVIWKLTDECLELTKNNEFSLKQLTTYYYENSLNIRLIYYLYSGETTTIVGLTQLLSISASSVHRRLRDINILLEEFDIQIRSNKFVGSEIQIRYFFLSIFFNHSFV